uniref:Calpain catalytic domain-containing protein n=1 Tax=Poecilia reticulata TaxID=8081 RepID=A0A3P9NLY2_POERE
IFSAVRPNSLDKYVTKHVLFEDPLFPADDSSLFYSEKPTMKFEWKRPSVSIPFSVFVRCFRICCT